MRAYERLIRYAKIHSSSRDGEQCTPSTEEQRTFSKLLAEEMKEIGLEEIFVDEHAYVYGVLPATSGMEDRPCIALIAHLDTIPDEDFPGKSVNPQLIPNYDGGEITLGSSGRKLVPDQLPDLKSLKGHTLITTDGTTVLGADDKAGIAEILTVCESLIAECLPHGRISVCFTPDEEIGHGAALLSLERLNADFGFTVDGGDVSEVNVETFNAAVAAVYFHGVNVHPGAAKNRMRNASHLAMEFDSMLPAAERPERTEGYEGFYHLTATKGNVFQAELNYIIRDHDRTRFEIRKEIMKQAVKLMNETYGENSVTLSIQDQYRNMKEILSDHQNVTALADSAICAAGLVPKHIPVRGGTDGAQLSFRGLPCPNLGTGGACFHGPYEYISIERMDKAVEILKNLLTVKVEERDIPSEC